MLQNTVNTVELSNFSLPVIAKNTANDQEIIFYAPEHCQYCRALEFFRCLSLLRTLPRIRKSSFMLQKTVKSVELSNFFAACHC